MTDPHVTCAHFEPKVESEFGDHLAKRSRFFAIGSLVAVMAALVVLLIWLLGVTQQIQRVADATSRTTAHTDGEVVRIVTDDQARIAALSADIAALVASGNAERGDVHSLEAQLATVHAELNAVLAATTAQQRQVIVEQYSTPSPAPPPTSTTTTLPPTTTTRPISSGRSHPHAGGQ